MMKKNTTNEDTRNEDLKNTDHAQATPLDVFKMARGNFLSGKRISFEELSRAIGISRVTLYRWHGNREQLVEDVLWSFAQPTFNMSIIESPGTGKSHIVEVHRRFMRAIADFEPMRRFVQDYPVAALNRMQSFDPNTTHGRIIEAAAAHMSKQVSLGHIQLTASPLQFAQIILQVNGALLYNSIIRDDPPGKAIQLASTITEQILVTQMATNPATDPADGPWEALKDATCCVA